MPPMNTTVASGNRLLSSPMESSSKARREAEVRCAAFRERRTKRNAGARQCLARRYRSVPACAAPAAGASRLPRGHLLEGRDDRFVFIRIAGHRRWHRAGSDPHGARRSVSSNRRTGDSGAALRAAKSYFRLPPAHHLLRRRADLRNQLRRISSLCANNRSSLRQHARERTSAARDNGRWPDRRCAVDQHQRRAGALRLSKKVGPDLGFHHHDQRRPQRAQHPPHGEDIIERRVENARQAIQFPIRGLESGQGGDRNEHRRARQASAQLPHQFHGRNGFAHRNGVQPNRAGDGLSKGSGQESATLPQGRK